MSELSDALKSVSILLRQSRPGPSKDMTVVQYVTAQVFQEVADSFEEIARRMEESVVKCDVPGCIHPAMGDRTARDGERYNFCATHYFSDDMEPNGD